MLKSLKPGTLWFFVAAVLLFPRLTPAKLLSIGSVGDAPTEEIQKFLSLANHVARQLHSDGFDQGKVVVGKTIPEMAAFLREGKVDLYIDSPFPSLAVSRLCGSKLLLRRWKNGISDYNAVIFTRLDSGLDGLKKLKGKMIAFKEPFSSSGYFLPKMFLMQQGFKLIPKKDASDPVRPGEVGYVFSSDEENTVAWVLREKVSAGAMDVQRYLEEAGKSPETFKIVHTTFSIPRHLVSHRADLPSKLVARIKDILTNMHLSEDGKKALEAFQKTNKFDELSNDAMAPLLKAVKFIDAELGIK
ncbi:MAG: phosphate/phosphite/phosphonate ABC transporter substrate-binding protein [Deltaproteobacteria bacterium]|nr:phosphate/phosphite/phosphonate ABC transporter substrate-binding protein [Deltaproteobacteria bacterium]